MTNAYILTFSCQDKPGIVAAVANFLANNGFNIEESRQFEDSHSQQFFMRTVFQECRESRLTLHDIKQRFASLAEAYGMQWVIQSRQYRPKLLIAVSQWGHCLNALLNSWKGGTLPVDIVGVYSNHETLRDLTEWYGVPYHYLPITAETKPQQEQQVMDLFAQTDADFLVLARYMQILSSDLTAHLSGKAINIHHSFLPGFKGAKPYHQAFDRGVKIIGATAHYVTSDLDEGPIIEQSVERVSHAYSPQELVETGRDIEAMVLNRAVKWHAEQRVLLNGHRTIVFDR